MVKIALVISTLILGIFSFVIADAHSYISLITNQVDDATLAGQWSLISVEFFVASFILAIGFIIHSRKK
jgi:hypothetical protein